MTNLRTDFTNWTDCLLDPFRSPAEHLEAAREWYTGCLAFFGVDPDSPRPDDTFFASTQLETGKAISPLAAAQCVREYRRTAVFLQSMADAIKAARQRFPNETLHVLEAGCGPLAPLSLPFAVRYPPEEVRFSLVDLHSTSIAFARRLAEELGVTRSIQHWIAADATTLLLAPEDRPHLIACEVLLATLRNEPQVAATLNLRSQLREGGFFLPERIAVDVALFHQRRYDEAASKAEGSPGEAFTELGPAFVLDAAEGSFPRCLTPTTLAARTVSVPPHDRDRATLHLCTRLQVFREHRLGDFDSSLNLPERIRHSPALATRGGTIEFYYEISSSPGLRTR